MLNEVYFHPPSFNFACMHAICGGNGCALVIVDEMQ